MRPKIGVFALIQRRENPPVGVSLTLVGAGDKVHFRTFCPLDHIAEFRAGLYDFPNGISAARVTVVRTR